MYFPYTFRNITVFYGLGGSSCNLMYCAHRGKPNIARYLRSYFRATLFDGSGLVNTGRREISCPFRVCCDLRRGTCRKLRLIFYCLQPSAWRQGLCTIELTIAAVLTSHQCCFRRTGVPCIATRVILVNRPLPSRVFTSSGTANNSTLLYKSVAK